MVYTPKFPSNITTVDALRQALTSELEKLVQSLPEQEEIVLSPLYRAPDKPRDGMVVFADGTHWNPGSGQGLYERRGGAWVKL